MSTLRIDRVCLERGGRKILHDCSLTIRRGELLAVIGPNGAGKSTILRLLNGLLLPTSGEVWLEEQPIRTWSRRELARQVTLVPQEARLEQLFTVAEVVAHGRYAHESRQRTDPTADNAVSAALRDADIYHLRERLVTELSGGERQRVLLARALATQAPFILMDEPTANLDLAHAFDILAVSRSLARSGQGIVVATHDLQAAWQLADRTVILLGGQICADGPTTSILTPERIRTVFGVTAEAVVAPSGLTGFLFRRHIGGDAEKTATP